MKTFLAFLFSAWTAISADLTLGVKFYGQVHNPTGIPSNWPADVLECADVFEEDAAEAAGYTIYSVAEYNALRADRQATYDAWATNLTNPRFKLRLLSAVSEEAERRIQGMFDAEDREKAKTRQQQLQARFSELTLLAVEAGGVTNLNASDQAEVTALRGVWAAVKAIRVTEYFKTNALATATNLADIGTNGVATAGWPGGS